MTCNNCGWIHFGVTRDFALAEVQSFKVYFNSLSIQDRENYYKNRPTRIEDYESCHRCGGTYRNFSKSKPGDCPDGCTIGPIINFNE